MSKPSHKQPGKIRRIFAGALLIIKLMGDYDEYRIAMALNKLKRSKFGVYLTNFFVFSVLAFVKLSSIVKERWQNLFVKNNKRDLSGIWDSKSPPRYMRSKPRILIVGEMLNKQCRLYRVDQKVQQLERLGWHCEVFSWQQLAEAQARLFNVDIVIFYRVVGTPKVLALIDYVRSLNKITVFDVDDLVFDKTLLEQKYLSESELLPDEVKQGNLYAADMYKLAAQHCDYAITTTQTLQTLLEKLVIQKKCFVLPNALSQEAFRIAELPKPDKVGDGVTLLYGSGSQTHDDDFNEVANALSRLMKKHNNLQIAVLGKLKLPAIFEEYGDRIIQLPILDFASYLMFVRQSDINIAPLQTDIFNDAKSEIKWLEAALFEIPTVMTPTKTYQQIVEPGVTGFFAETQEQWFSHLDQLIESDELRKTLGQNAKRMALEHYGPEVMSAKLKNVMLEAQEHALSVGILHQQLSKTKKSIMIVDSYYSPADAHHDPMISVRRQIEQLTSEHAEDFEILVVTADPQDTEKYAVNKHALNGVRVRVMGVGDNFERLNDYQNQRIKNTFQELVDYFAPDIIHFHHLERLSGSVIEVARESSIPYAVTIYDSCWWLTAGKYRSAQKNRIHNELHDLDPFSMINQQVDVNDKLTRTIYLAELLSNAARVFSLSPDQFELLKLNGIESTMLREGVGYPDTANLDLDSSEVENKEYVPKVALFAAKLDTDDQVLISLKDAVNSIGLSKLEVHFVDFSELADFNSELDIQGCNISVRGGWSDDRDASQFISRMDGVLLGPDWHAQSDLILQEASAQGAWLIAPNTISFVDSVKSSNYGVLYDIDNPDNLQETLQQLIAKDKEEGDRRVFSLSESVDQLASHYQDIHSSNLSDTL